MNIGFLITARLKSSRLPMKILLDLNGRNVIQRVIDRAKKIDGINDIVLCTSGDPQDMPLFRIARQENIYAFPGHPQDVLKRLLDAARLFRMDHFVGITADNPLFSFEQGTLLTNHVQQNPETDFAYYDNLPIGANLYIVKTRMLEIIYKFKPEGDTEIWGEWVKQPDFFNINLLTPPPNLQDIIDNNLRMTLDEYLDYVEFSNMYRQFPSNHTPSMIDVAKCINEYDIFAKNKQVLQQNTSEEYSTMVNKFFQENRSELKRIIKEHEA